MITRCQNTKRDNYAYYGGRGIKVDERWLEANGFSNFLEDMGDRPDGYTLDRIDVDGNYTKSNCRWASKFTQMANTRTAGETPGVSWDSRRRNWRVRVKVNRKEHYIGCFKNRAEAVKACDKYRKQMGFE